MSEAWTAAQIAVLKEYTDLSHIDAAKLCCFHGPARTGKAVEAQRFKLGLKVEGAKERRSAAMRDAKGWPTLRGSDEARDRQFQRMAMDEALRLGLLSTGGDE